MGLRLVMLLLLLLPAQQQLAAAPEAPAAVPPYFSNPGAEVWNAVRQRDDLVLPARTRAPRPDDTVLIDVDGENFRHFRNEKLTRYGGWALAGVLFLLALYHLVHGPVRIEGGESGERVQRFKRYDLVLHWVLAGTFLILAFTGLLFLFGRLVIIPWLGIEAFGPIALASKWIHNLLGPPFAVVLVLFFIHFVRKNLPRAADLVWLAKLGGFLGNSHPPAGFFNAGEKILFWLLIVIGTGISVSGLVLDFPFVVDSAREPLRLAQVIHGLTTVALMAVIIGHIYLGSIGTEGTLQSMTRGSVDTNWAKTHHAIWYEDVTRQQGEEQEKSADPP